VIHRILELIMMRRSLRLILPVFLALGAACGDGGFAPRLFMALEVSPTAFALFTVPPGNTLQLTILAYDQTGATLPFTSGATYSSNAPAIAGVSNSGVVTAAAPGTAKITAALTLGGETRTASVTVKVYAGDYSDIPGVYDLTAPITTFDPARGVDLEGYRYTAVLTLEELRPPWIGGTYADVRLIGPSGDTTALADTGFVYTDIDPDGGLLIELVRDWDQTDGTLMPATLAPGFIDGTFDCCGHISGTFTATRR
jgi:hypothetical protein